MNSERLLKLADYLDKVSKEKWDHTIFVSVDSKDVLLKGDSLGHCTVLWPKEFYIKDGQLYSKEGSRNPLHHATEFFDMTLTQVLNLFGSHHAVDYFKTSKITAGMVADKIRELLGCNVFVVTAIEL